MSAYAMLMSHFNNRRAGSTWKAMDSYGWLKLKMTASGEFLLYTIEHTWVPDNKRVPTGTIPIVRVSQNDDVTLLPGIKWFGISSFNNRFRWLLGVRRAAARYSECVKYRTRFCLTSRQGVTLPLLPFVSWNARTGKVLWRPEDDAVLRANRSRARALTKMARDAARVTLTVAELQGSSEFVKERLSLITGDAISYFEGRARLDHAVRIAREFNDMEAFYAAALDYKIALSGWWMLRMAHEHQANKWRRMTNAAHQETLHQLRLIHDGYTVEAMQ